MTGTVYRITRLDKSRVQIISPKGDSLTCRITTDSRLRSILKKCGPLTPVAMKLVRGVFDELDSEDTTDVDLSPAELAKAEERNQPPLTVKYRDSIESGEWLSATDPSSYNAFHLAVTACKAGGEVRWDGLERLAALDIDVPRDEPVTDEEFTKVLDSLATRPRVMWFSRNDGLKLIYQSQDGATAKARASAAAVEVSAILPRVEAEILPRTRTPEEGKRVVSHIAETDGDRVWPWRMMTTDSTLDRSLAPQVEEWLGEQGFTKGFGRYPHGLCPFDPCTTRNPPLDISESGIYCYRCEAKGGRYRVSWRALLEGVEVSRIEQAAANRVTFEHAKIVIDEDYPCNLSYDILRDAYQLLCVDLAPDVLKAVASAVTREYHLIRGVGGTWLNSQTLTPIMPKVNSERLAELPYVWRARSGEVYRCPVRHNMAGTDEPLDGWTPVLPVRGARIWGQFLDYRDKSYARAQVSAPGKSPFEYIPRPSRVSLSECESYLCNLCPGLDTGYLRLLLCARGFAESGSGPVPMIVATGPTSAGKSATAKLAAEVVGDRTYTVMDNHETRMNIGQGAAEAGILLLDEFGKGSAGEGPPRKVFDLFLHVERRYVYRKMYHGSFETRINSAIIATNTAYSAETLSHQQAARRVVYVPLARRIEDWRDTAGDVTALRHDNRHTRYLDSYLSHIIDNHFSDESATWAECVHDLGFQTLEEYLDDSEVGESDDGIEQAIRDLVAAIRVAPQGSRKGWVEIDLNAPEGQTWLKLADGRTGHAAGSSVIIRERDLVSVLDYGGEDRDDVAIRLFSRRSGLGKVDVRLVLTPRSASTSKVIALNRELVKMCKGVSK